MGIVTHIAVNSVVGASLYSVNLIDFNEAILLVCSNILDLDHFIFYSIESRSIDINKFVKAYYAYFAEMMPRFYIFHTMEFLLLLVSLSIIFSSRILYIFIFGWLIHVILDIIKYIFFYKKNLAWFNYWLLFKWKKLK